MAAVAVSAAAQALLRVQTLAHHCFRHAGNDHERALAGPASSCAVEPSARGAAAALLALLRVAAL